MGIVDSLREQREGVKAKLDALQEELADLDAAIMAVEARRPRHEQSTPTRVEAPAEAAMTRQSRTISIDDAIIEAIGNGQRAPAQILRFLDRQMGIHTTINSVRTRVSRLKKQGRLSHDSRGWVLPGEVDERLPLNENDAPAGAPDVDAGGESPPPASDPFNPAHEA